MQQSQQQHSSRINLVELKAQIVKKLGPERSKRYFYYLNRLLSQKLSKGEFDKLCYRTIGRENLPLHNQLIRSILKNACNAKGPPPVHEREVPKPLKAAGKKSPPREEGYQQSRPSPSPTQVPNSLIFSNGDVLPMSPRKVRSGIRDRRLRDRPSPLGPNGKTDYMSHQSSTADSGIIKFTMENGDLNQCDFQRPKQHHQGLAEQPENEQAVLLQHPLKRPQIKRSPDDLVSVHSKAQIEVVSVEDGAEVEETNKSNSSRSLLQAPLGIPFCSASVGGARRPFPMTNSSNFASSFDGDGLSDTETLKKRIELIAGAQGLEGVSMECANLLNNGLDVYLKRLIRSCIELVGSRSGHEPTRHPVHKQQPRGKHINGILPGHHLQMHSSSGAVEGIQEQRTHCPISLLDFKVAMELNPRQLGEDWTLLLEKICIHSFEE